MRGLGSTLNNLVRQRRQWAEALGSIGGREEVAASPASVTPLVRIRDFGSNPGALEMFTHVPQRLPPAPALVVVLHGCGQDAGGYNDGAGWSALADRQGFVLLFPQQVSANNPKTCFNWFLPGDVARGSGEAMSIRQMIDRAVADYGVDRSRIFITGLSAGGAMSAAMLAAYPEVFAAGAIVAGLPVGAATNVQTALNSMFQGQTRTARDWGDRVRAASRHRGPWPRVSIWYGEADTIVKPVNGLELVKQWTDIHGLLPEPSHSEAIGPGRRDIWRDPAGREVVEAVAIQGMGHGTPLHVGGGDMEGGSAGPFMLDVGLSSTHHIAQFWGLLDKGSIRNATAPPVVRTRPPFAQAKDGEILPPETKRPLEMPKGTRKIGPVPLPDSVPTEVLAVIQKAFKAAGLVK